MSAYPLVSIITINYNSIESTIEFLDSIYSITYTNYEVIVVDNASDEFDHEIIEIRFPKAKIIMSKTNLGFAGGNNLGIKEASGEFVLFLNNDTVVENDFLDILIGGIRKLDNIGMVSPLIKYYDSNIIQYAGSVDISPITGRGSRIGRNEDDINQYKGVYGTDLIHGAAFLVSKEAIAKAGEMFDGYFLYYEEYDWCLRIRKLGYDILVNADSTVYHKESVSIGRNSPLKTYYMSRNRPYFIRRNSTTSDYALHIIYLLLIVLPKGLLEHLIKRDWANLSAFVKGSINGLIISFKNEV